MTEPRMMKANPKTPENEVHGVEHDEVEWCTSTRPHCFPVFEEWMVSETGVPDWPGRIHTSAPHRKRDGCASAPYCRPAEPLETVVANAEGVQQDGGLLSVQLGRKPEPSYYDGQGGMQPWDVWKAFDLDPWEANLIKYVLRAGKKPGESKLKDLKKARSYLNYLIKRESSSE